MSQRNCGDFTRCSSEQERKTKISSKASSTVLYTDDLSHNSADTNRRDSINTTVSRPISLRGSPTLGPDATVITKISPSEGVILPKIVDTGTNAISLDRYHEPSCYEKLHYMEMMHSDNNNNNNSNNNNDSVGRSKGCSNESSNKYFVEGPTKRPTHDAMRSSSGSFPTLPPISSLDSGILEAEREHSGNTLETPPVSAFQGGPGGNLGGSRNEYRARSASLFNYPLNGGLSNSESSPNDSSPVITSVPGYFRKTKFETSPQDVSSRQNTPLPNKIRDVDINQLGEDIQATTGKFSRGNLLTSSVLTGEASMPGEEVYSPALARGSAVTIHDPEQTTSPPGTLSPSSTRKVVKPRRKKQCPICLKFFANLSTHKSTHLTPEDRPHLCPICQRGFARNNDLIRHKKRHWQDEVMAKATASAKVRGPKGGSDAAVTEYMKHERLKSLHQIEGTFKCPYNSALIQLDMEMYPEKAQPLKYGTSNCHQTGVFSRCDTYKNHLKALHFEYPSGTRKKDRGSVPGRCKHCGESFDNVEVWLHDHVGKTCGYTYHR